MDELAKKTQKTKVLNVKLKIATQNIAQLEEERYLVKGCISEINHYLMRIIETNDSSVTTYVRQNLSEKLQPIFSMLNQIQGVLGSGASVDQGGDKEEKIQEKKEKGSLKMTMIKIRKNPS